METLRRNRPLSLMVIAAAAALVLSGCAQDAPAPVDSAPPATAPTPTETASESGERPAITDLVLTTEGLGDLTFGVRPSTDNPATDLVTYSPDACVDTGSPNPDLWVANYPAADEGFGPQAPFAISVKDDALTRIDVNTTHIITEDGLGLESSLDALLGTYPGGPDEVYNHADVSDVYVFLGTTGKLLFEVAVDRIPGYWDASQLNTVVHLSSVSLDTATFGAAATDNVIGVCNNS